MIRKPIAAALVLAVLSGAPTASAQTAPAAAPLGGPVIPGLCILGRDALFANAKVGQAAAARLKVLTDQAQAELDRERAPLEAEAKALEAQAKTLSPAQFEERRAALGPKLEAFQRKAAIRTREIELTRQKATDRISAEAEPVVTQVYKARNCGALFSRDAMMGANPQMDITQAVLQALDAKITTIAFDREVMPTSAGTR